MRSNQVSTAHRKRSRFEPLESRTLMSATWNTVYSDPNPNGSEGIKNMAADNAGNVYSIATEYDADENPFQVVMQKTAAGQWSTLLTAGAEQGFNALATDKSGDVFIAGQSRGSNGAGVFTVWEKPATQAAFSVVDSVPGSATGITTDRAGDVFADGTQPVTTTTTSKGKTTTTTTSYSIIRKLTPSTTSPGSFVATTVYLSNAVILSNDPQSITVIDSGASAGIYAVGDNSVVAPQLKSFSGNYWDVLKSTDGGAHWSLVDQLNYGGASAGAYAVSGDGLGNVYVCGAGHFKYYTGFSYIAAVRWLVRKSGTGNSGSWSTADDFLPQGYYEAAPAAMGADLAGNIYVVGTSIESFAGGGGPDHAIVRTNAGGNWSTADDYTGTSAWASYSSFAMDSNGVVYAGGWDVGANSGIGESILRSPNAPVTFSTTQISGTDNALLDLISPSTNLLGKRNGDIPH